jgi:hypothetical protein
MTGSMRDDDDERQPLLLDSDAPRNPAVPGRGLPWSQIAILGIWRATHASEIQFSEARQR